MTGDKPDPRLRTPMHWARGRAAGFTRGTPWEPLRPDSLTANVEAQDGDPASLLNHYRWLIHLRAAHPALGSSGEFVPLDAADDAVMGYLRRGEGRTVLVLANLGDRRLSAVALSSAGAILPPGRYVARPLPHGGSGAPLRVRADGRLSGWSPVPTLEPFETRILELARRD